LQPWPAKACSLGLPLQTGQKQKLVTVVNSSKTEAHSLGLHWQSQSLQPWPAVANPTLPAVAKSSKNAQKRQLSPKKLSVQIVHFY